MIETLLLMIAVGITLIFIVYSSPSLRLESGLSPFGFGPPLKVIKEDIATIIDTFPIKDPFPYKKGVGITFKGNTERRVFFKRTKERFFIRDANDPAGPFEVGKVYDIKHIRGEQYDLIPIPIHLKNVSEIVRR